MLRDLTYMIVKFWSNWDLGAGLRETYCQKSRKVLAKHKQHDNSTTTIAMKKWTAAIDSRHRVHPVEHVPAPARQQDEGAHKNPRNGVALCDGLADNASDARHPWTIKRWRGLRGLPHRCDYKIQSEQEKWTGRRRSWKWDEQRAYGFANGDGDSGNIHRCGEHRRKHIWLNGDKWEQQIENEGRGSGTCPQLNEPYGENNAYASSSTDAAAPTVEHLADVVEAQAPRKKAQWLGIM